MTPTRRDFLRTSAVSAVGLASASPALAGRSDAGCIFLVLVGGPSQLDTWDPKPNAPSEVRGPFKPIATRTPGVLLSELFPRMAAHSNLFTLVRSMHHSAAPVHETGLQIMQTGRLAKDGEEAPHLGALLGMQDGNVLLPGPIGFTGVSVGHGQSAGRLDEDYAPRFVDVDIANDPQRDCYGRTEFGDNCLRAARLIERGTRFVTVNMFQTVYDTITWDCHAAGGSLRSGLADYRRIGTAFDIGYTALLADLRDRGLLSNTLVVASGEFGRTPHLNRDGGRDHWAGVWTSLLAGAGTTGGQVIGSSDSLGAEPKDQPVKLERLAGSIAEHLDVSGGGIPCGISG